MDQLLGKFKGMEGNAPLAFMLKNPLLGWHEIKFNYLIEFHAGGESWITYWGNLRGWKEMSH